MSAVYFIRPIGSDGPVKVGFARNPVARLAACESSSPLPLEIAAALQVELADVAHWNARGHVQAIERRFHERYLPWHLHHEWFAFNGLMAQDIEAIRSGEFDHVILPAASAATWRLPPASRGTKGHVGRPAWAA